jgi:hypothetical protein
VAAVRAFGGGGGALQCQVATGHEENPA